MEVQEEAAHKKLAYGPSCSQGPDLVVVVD